MTDELIRLKTVNPWFQDVWDRRKPFEVRNNDRNFYVGQELFLLEYDPLKPEQVTNTREILIRIDYILPEGAMEGLSPGFVCFAFTELKRYIAAFGPDADAFP